MWKVPVEFLSGVSGTGFQEISDQWSVIRITDDNGVTIPDDPAYSYRCTGEAVQVSVDAPPDQPAAPSYGTVITKHAFRNRFTIQEKAAVEAAALPDPSAATEVKQLGAVIRSYLRDLDMATEIDIALPEVRNGLLYLESVGLLAEGTASRVCDAPATYEETVV